MGGVFGRKSKLRDMNLISLTNLLEHLVEKELRPFEGRESSTKDLKSRWILLLATFLRCFFLYIFASLYVEASPPCLIIPSYMYTKLNFDGSVINGHVAGGSILKRSSSSCFICIRL